MIFHNDATPHGVTISVMLPKCWHAAPSLFATAASLLVAPFFVDAFPPFGFFAPPLLPGPLSGMARSPPRGLQDDISLSPLRRLCLLRSSSPRRAESQKRGWLLKKSLATLQ